MDINEILSQVKGECSCGRCHTIPKTEIVSGNGAVRELTKYINRFGALHPYILSDRNTENVAGFNVKKSIKNDGKTYSECFYDTDRIVPDEKSVGFALMNYQPDCDAIISVGSGVLNDIGKIVANVTGRPYILVATAPSMDGFASLTSSMELKGLKTSLNSKAADVIIGDTDILKSAPDIMLKAGLGDMLAKFISICEWKISHIVTGEYYCEKTAEIVKTALKICTDNAEALMKRNDDAVKATFEGLVLSGIAMNIAGCSRPASGIEHYFSHIWDMRSLEFNLPDGLHGINCAIGTSEAFALYQKMLKIKPDKEKALAHAKDFDLCAWNKKLAEFIGSGAKTMIEAEKKDGKYNAENHAARLKNIINNWNEITDIIKNDLPDEARFNSIYKVAQIPANVKDIGLDESIIPMTFLCTKDIRNKYILSMLAWDLGIEEELISNN